MCYHCYLVMLGLLSHQKELLTQNETYSARFLRLLVITSFSSVFGEGCEIRFSCLALFLITVNGDHPWNAKMQKNQNGFILETE